MQNKKWFMWCLNNHLKVIPLTLLILITLFATLILFPLEVLILCILDFKSTLSAATWGLKLSINYTISAFNDIYLYKKELQNA